MKRLGIALLFLAVITGCSATQEPKVAKSEAPKVVLSNKFQLHNATLHLSELIDAEASYHTEKELQELLNMQLKRLLENKKLLTQDKRANTLVITVNYERRFVGDKTPMPSHALAYPSYAYSIDVMDHKKLLTGMTQKKKSFKGGLAMSKQVITKALNDKRYENTFINALARDIVKSIQALQKK